MQAKPLQQPEPKCQGQCTKALKQRLADAEREVASLRRELEEAHRLALLGTLAAGIAHEFNNILTPALNAAELASTDSKEAADALGLCSTAIRRVAAVSDAILKLGRGDTRFHVEQSSPPSAMVGEAVEEALRCMGRDPAQTGLDIRLSIEPDLAAAISPIALEQVLLNLILNAMDAMPKGGPLEIAGTTVHGGRGPEVRIEVTDRGRGIPADHVDQIFESFVSLSDDSARSGLGLMVCRQLIESAGGAITVQSMPGAGSTFTIRLPQAPRRELRRSA